MTAEEIIYDILEIKNALEDDHDIEPLWLLQKINNYRAIFILDDYKRNGEIKPDWLQRLRKIQTTKITSADDPAITYTSILLSKATIPSILTLPDDMGLVRVTGSSGILPYDQVAFDTLMMKIHFEEEKMGSFGYYSRMGSTLYIWPLVMEIQAVIIPADPMDVQVLDPITNTLRARTIADEYPLDIAIAQQIVLEICTKDLQLNMKSIADITNDSKHQLRILQSEAGQSKE